MSVSDFVNRYKSYAQTAADALGNGITANDILGQWGLERGWNPPSTAGGINNLAGIKPGSRTNPGGGTFMNYDSVDDFVNDYIVQMRRIVTTRDGNTFLEKLANGSWVGYDAPANKDYSNRVASAIGSVTGNPVPYSPTPSTDMTIHKGITGFTDGINKYVDDLMTKGNPQYYFYGGLLLILVGLVLLLVKTSGGQNSKIVVKLDTKKEGDEE